jgi:N-acetylmuramoyl-L-alanine amidase
MGLHKSEDNLEVAKTENAAILLEDNYHEQYDGFDPNLDEDYIMLNMFQSANIEQSLVFSQILQDQMRHTAEMYDRGVRQAGFVVLYLTTMPGVLLEAGFLSNPGEEKFLMDEANQERIAIAIVEAIRIYKQEAELKFEAISADNGKDTIQESTEADKVYRIGFMESKKEKPRDDKIFSGMEEVWHYYDNGRYHYTFGKAKSLVQAKDFYYRAVADGKIKWKYLKSAKIVVSEGDKVNSKITTIVL